MAEVPFEFRGTLYDLLNRTSQQVVLQGSAGIWGLGVGGGPIIPPPGGSGGHPEHPIVPPGGYPHPEHPIVIPEPPTELPPDVPNPVPPNTVLKTAPEGGWGLYSDENGAIYWAYNPSGNVVSGPKRR